MEAYVKKIIFASKESSYKIVLIEEKNADDIVVVGNMPSLVEGAFYEFELGEEYMHHKYGSQRNVISFKVAEIDNLRELEIFLASDAFKGIGKKTAKLIVDKFGDDALHIIKNDIDRLQEVGGIGKKTLGRIKESISKHFEISDKLFELGKLGFTIAQSEEILDMFGREAIQVIRDNPYMLLNNIKSLNFMKVDKIAIEKLNFELSSRTRIENFIFYAIDKINFRTGDMCIRKDYLENIVSTETNQDIEEIKTIIKELINDEFLYLYKKDDKEYIYTKDSYEIEKTIAYDLERIKKSYTSFGEIGTYNSEIILSEEQKSALNSAFKSGVFILTGPAGSGKTTILKELCDNIKNLNLDFALAAPTGKAASRMTEILSIEAKTIHRLLDVKEINGEHFFEQDRSNPLEYEVVIIDEASMIDAKLFSSLLQAIKSGTLLVLVGDSNQLPPVSEGFPFNEMIKSNLYNTGELKGIHRQAKESSILKNAHSVLNSESIKYNSETNDFFLFDIGTEYGIMQKVLELVSTRIPEKFGFDKNESITVLTPVRKGHLGCENLNRELQARLNTNSSQMYFKKFRLGDKVMHIKNNYQLESVDKITGEIEQGVFNGETGRIVDINHEYIKVLYGDKKFVSYSPKEVYELDLAYALTIHKSQGNEFEVVVFPSFNFYEGLDSLNLIYTLITRAKKLFVVCGNKKYFERAMRNSKTISRQTFLIDFIKKQREWYENQKNIC